MSDRIELTSSNLLEGLAGEIRSESGPGEFTKAFNEALIAEFRANAGKLSGDFEDAQFLLLTTTGAKSGKRRTTPLAYIPIDGRILIVASKGGAKTHPAWYWNLLAHPEVTVEIGTDTYPAEAVALNGVERDRLYGEIATRVPTFAQYQTRTDRVIPLFELRQIKDNQP